MATKRKSLEQQIEDHVDFLEETLIPDLKESGMTPTARTFEECIALFRHPSKSELQRMVRWLNSTLIPDLKASGYTATAEDFETCVRLMKKQIRELDGIVRSARKSYLIGR